MDGHLFGRRRAQTPPETGVLTAEHSPVYEHAKRDWNFRHRELARQRNIATAAAGVASLIAVMAVAGVIYIGGQSKVETVLIEVNALGDAIEAQPVGAVKAPDPRVARFQIAEFIVNARSVLTDPAGQNRNLRALWNLIDKESPAARQIQEWFSPGNLPSERARREVVSVEIGPVTVVGNTWRVEWIETYRDLTGRNIGKKNMQATLVTTISPPKDVGAALLNPTGLFVTDVSWTERGGRP